MLKCSTVQSLQTIGVNLSCGNEGYKKYTEPTTVKLPLHQSCTLVINSIGGGPLYASVGKL